MESGHCHAGVRVGEECMTCITEGATGDLASQREVSRRDDCFGD